MTVDKIKKELADLRIAAEAKRRANVYEPSCQFSPWLKSRDAAWRAELESVPGNKYEWLLANLHRAPKRPLKSQFAHLASDDAGVRRLYDLVKP